jgi:hypothetical protein
MEQEGFGDGEGAAVAELGVVVVWVSYESPASEVGMEATVNASPDKTVADGGHAGDPIDGVPFQGLTPFQEGFPYSREVAETIDVGGQTRVVDGVQSSVSGGGQVLV